MFSGKWLAPLALAALAAGCGFPLKGMSKNTIEGSGPVKSEDRPATGFEAVHAGGAFQLDIKVGGKDSVTVAAQENLLKEIKTEVSGGVLSIDSDYNLNSNEPIKVTITVAKLRELEVSGASQAKVEGLDGDSFALNASGAGKVKLAGSADELKVDGSGACDIVVEGLRAKKVTAGLSGSSSLLASGSAEVLEIELNGASQFKGEELASTTAEVDATGASQAIVNAKDKVLGSASGASTIRYKGNPKSSLSSSGASTIKQIP